MSTLPQAGSPGKSGRDEAPVAVERRENGALPIEQYSALGEGRSVALTGCDGSID